MKVKQSESADPDQSVTEEVSPPPRCAWSCETYDPLEGETPTPPEECATGKPALFYNCNEYGPVCEDHICRCRPSLLTERAAKTSRRARDLIIRRLYNERHRLLDLERQGANVADDLAQDEAQINKHEMAEYEEQTGPFRRKQNRELKALAEKLRPLVPAEAMIPVDAAILRLLGEPEPASAEPEESERAP